MTVETEVQCVVSYDNTGQAHLRVTDVRSGIMFLEVLLSPEDMVNMLRSAYVGQGSKAQLRGVDRIGRYSERRLTTAELKVGDHGLNGTIPEWVEEHAQSITVDDWSYPSIARNNRRQWTFNQVRYTDTKPPAKVPAIALPAGTPAKAAAKTRPAKTGPALPTPTPQAAPKRT